MTIRYEACRLPDRTWGLKAVDQIGGAIELRDGSEQYARLAAEQLNRVEQIRESLNSLAALPASQQLNNRLLYIHGAVSVALDGTGIKQEN